MYELGRASYEWARPVFAPLAHHLAITGILDGATPGRVFVDDPARPSAALAWTKYRLYLSAVGDAVRPAQIDALQRLFTGALYPQARAAGQEGFILTYAPAAWPPTLEAALAAAGGQVFADRRQYYVCEALAHDWRPMLPAGFALVPVDAALLADERLAHRERLAEEMCSERPSVDDFLSRSFGVALLHSNGEHAREIAGWCLSEYNTATRCEVGIETGEAHRRQGLGAALTLALVETAFSRGVTQVGWDCWARNLPSSATARRAGFTLLADEPVYYVRLS